MLDLDINLLIYLEVVCFDHLELQKLSIKEVDQWNHQDFVLNEIRWLYLSYPFLKTWKGGFWAEPCRNSPRTPLLQKNPESEVKINNLSRWWKRGQSIHWRLTILSNDIETRNENADAIWWSILKITLVESNGDRRTLASFFFESVSSIRSIS